MLNFDKSEISAIMVRKVVGEITAQEQAVLDQWLAKSECNREAYQRFISGEGRAEREQILSDMNSDDFIESVHSKIRRHYTRKLMLRTASAAVVAAMIAVGVYVGFIGNKDETPNPQLTQQHVLLSLDDGSSFELNNDTEDSEWQQLLTTKIETGDTVQTPKIVNVKVEVPHGVNYKLRLNDGTIVWLNAETQIEYPNVFSGSERNVHIRGEAYFDVAHNPDKPFVVTTSDQVDIRVLGTKFNVSCYDNANNTSVTLEQGSVYVSYNDTDVVLERNQQAIIKRADHKLRVQTVDASAYSAWKDGMFDFRSASFDEILSSMSRWYGIDFVLEDVDTSNLGLMTINVEKGDDFSYVKSIMEKITGLEFMVKGSKVYVSQ